MFKLILILLLVGGGGYFLLQKVETDKLNKTNSIAEIKADENSSATARIIKNIANEN